MKSNIKEQFYEYVGPADSLAGYTRSYKLVLYKALFSLMDKDGKASVSDVVDYFISFYKQRADKGLITDKEVVGCIEDIYSCTYEQALRVIRVNPYKHIHEAGFLYWKKNDDGEFFVLPYELIQSMTSSEIKQLLVLFDLKLNLYYERIEHTDSTNQDSANDQFKDLAALEQWVLKRGKYISFLKKRYFVPNQEDIYKIKRFADRRGMTESEYEYFLAGCEFSAPRSTTDETIIKFFENNKTKDGRVFVPADPHEQWIRSFADRYNLSMSELADLFGYSYYEIRDHEIDNSSYTMESRIAAFVEQQRNINNKEEALRELRIDLFLRRILAKPIEQRSLPLPSDDELFTERITRLTKKAEKELKKNKYISDIRIDEDEYKTLRAYLHYAVKELVKSNKVASFPLFVTAVVHVAVKVYARGNFWGNFFKEIAFDNKTSYQRLVGKAFTDICEQYNKMIVDKTQYVQNILLHCYISDQYAPSYFEFLYRFYDLDIDRDIDRLNPKNGGKEIMDALMSSICSEEGGRAYMLVQHISQAMAANPKGARTRVRNHLKKLDKFFWNYDYTVNTNHRIYNLMQEWIHGNKEITDIYKSRGLYGKKRKKVFSYPYVFFDESIDSLKIVIPSQSIKKENNEDVYWKVTGAEEKRIPCQLLESVIGYKVQEVSFVIPWANALKQYKIQLINGAGDVIKSFPIRETDVRFFDNNGFQINSNNLKIGDVVSVSEKNVLSSALYDKRTVDGIIISYYQLEYEDIIKLPNGNAVIVGKDVIENGLIGKGLVEGVNCQIAGEPYSLYNYIPHFAIRLLPNKVPGTAITVNGQRKKLEDLDAVQFSIDDRTGDIGYYIDLYQFVNGNNGIYQIEIDIPGSIKRGWRFVYIEDFSIQYEQAPYVFEPRATVTFNDFIEIKNINQACSRIPKSNSFQFEIEDVGRYLNFSINVDGAQADISAPVPALFIKQNNGTWTSKRPPAIWYKDLPDEIDLAVPYHKVELSIDESDDEVRTIEYKKTAGEDVIHCDLVKFKSYLIGADSKSIRVKFGDIDETVLFSVIIHSRVITMQLLGNYDENEVFINSTIVGKATYFADLSRAGSLIAEKVLLTNGDAAISYEIENDEYEVEFFEAEEDESGFGYSYYSIGRYKQHLLNPFDMSTRSIKIIQIEKIDDQDTILPLKFDYYIENLKKTKEKNTYDGMMVVEKTSYFPQAAFEVKVIFKDIKDPSLIWVEYYEDEDYSQGFLYDTKRQAFLQDENPQLNKKACYVRYTALYDDEYQFRIDFCDRELSDYDSMPAVFELHENNIGSLFTRKKPSKTIYETYISDITWGKIEYEYLRVTGFTTLRELSGISKMQFMKMTGADDNVANNIAYVMSKYGYRFGYDY